MIIKIMELIRDIGIVFTLIYMWCASCLFLLYNVNTTSANACFYGGVVVIVLTLLTSPRVKSWVRKKEVE